MVNVKTILTSLALAWPATTVSATEADPQLRFFATCAGRLSALMEHQWNHDTAASETTSMQRAEMIALVSSIMPADAGRAVLMLRVEAKHAQAGLLRRAVHAKNPDEAAWAQGRSAALVSECTSILLGSDA